MTRNARLPLLALALSIVLADRAEAHAHLRSAAPSPGSTVAASPHELDLVFSESVNLAFTGITVRAPDGSMVNLGGATLGPDGGKTLVVPVPATLVPGLYRVDWHALATDGHKTDGSYTFSIGP